MEYLKLAMYCVMIAFIPFTIYFLFTNKIVINTETSKMHKALAIMIYVAAFSTFTKEAAFILLELIK